MTETLYDPEVEKRGIEIGRQEGIKMAISELLKEAFAPENIAELSSEELEKLLKVRDRLLNRCD